MEKSEIFFGLNDRSLKMTTNKKTRISKSFANLELWNFEVSIMMSHLAESSFPYTFPL